MTFLPDSCSLLEHSKWWSAQVSWAFGHRPVDDLLPLPGECLWMASPCHEARVDELHCKKHTSIAKQALMARVAEAVLQS